MAASLSDGQKHTYEAAWQLQLYDALSKYQQLWKQDDTAESTKPVDQLAKLLALIKNNYVISVSSAHFDFIERQKNPITDAIADAFGENLFRAWYRKTKAEGKTTDNDRTILDCLKLAVEKKPKELTFKADIPPTVSSKLVKQWVVFAEVLSQVKRLEPLLNQPSKKLRSNIKKYLAIHQNQAAPLASHWLPVWVAFWRTKHADIPAPELEEPLKLLREADQTFDALIESQPLNLNRAAEELKRIQEILTKFQKLDGREVRYIPQSLVNFRERWERLSNRNFPLELTDWDWVLTNTNPGVPGGDRASALMEAKNLFMQALTNLLYKQDQQEPFTQAEWGLLEAFASELDLKEWGRVWFLRNDQQVNHFQTVHTAPDHQGDGRCVSYGWAHQLPDQPEHVPVKARFLVPRPLPPIARLLSELVTESGRFDQGLASESRRMKELIISHPDDWHRVLNLDEEKRWWLILQRGFGWAQTEDRMRSLMVDLQKELQPHDYQLVDWDGDTSTIPRPWSKAWHLVPVAANEPQPLPALTTAPNAVGVALRLPSGELLLPAGWLRVPRQESPLQKWWSVSEPQRQVVAEQTANWPIWNKLRHFHTLIPYLDRDPDKTLLIANLVRELLVVLLKDACATVSPTQAHSNTLSCDLAKCLQQIPTLRLWPMIDSCNSNSAVNDIPVGTTIRWEASDQAVGKRIRIEHYGVGTLLPASVCYSAGPTKNTHQALLLTPVIPWPECHPLLKLEKFKRNIPQKSSETINSQLDTFIKKLEEWLLQEDGSRWLNESAHSLVNRTASDGLHQWWDVLFTTNVLPIYPAFNLESGAVYWPLVDSKGLQIRWEKHATIRKRYAVSPRTVHFSLRPDEAQGTFSLGMVEPESPIGRYERLREGERALGSGGAALLDPLWPATVAAQLGDGFQLDPQAITAIVNRVGEGWLLQQTPEQVEFLVAFRDWLENVGAELLPQQWAPSKPGAVPESLPPHENERPIFSTAPLGERLLQQFGVQPKGGQPWQAVRVLRSAGAAPKLLDELRQSLQGLDPTQVAPLLDNLERWPTYAADGKLENHAIRWFMDFWKAAEPHIKTGGIAGDWRITSELLDRMLIANYNLKAFYPKHETEYAVGWIKNVASDSRAQRVRRVLCPGLSKMSQLRLQATVELE